MLAENLFLEKMDFFCRYLIYNAQKGYKMGVQRSKTTTLLQNWS